MSPHVTFICMTGIHVTRVIIVSNMDDAKSPTENIFHRESTSLTKLFDRKDTYSRGEDLSF